MEEKIRINTQKCTANVGGYDPETNTLVFAKKMNHLYKNLNAFCVNYDILVRYPDWKKIRMVCEELVFVISRDDYENFSGRLNNFISYCDEKQVAIPICIFSKYDKNTHKTYQSGKTAEEFVTTETLKPEYANWTKRIKANYFFS